QDQRAGLRGTAQARQQGWLEGSAAAAIAAAVAVEEPRAGRSIGRAMTCKTFRGIQAGRADPETLHIAHAETLAERRRLLAMKLQQIGLDRLQRFADLGGIWIDEQRRHIDKGGHQYPQF